MIKINVFGSGSSGNGYLIDDGYSQLIIEMGVSMKTIFRDMKHDLSRVAGCLISHEHRDHCKYIKRLVDETSIDVYATTGTNEAMFDDSVLRLEQTDKYRFNQLVYKETTVIGTWYVTPFETQHDVREPCGFLIDTAAGDRLVFVTDSYYVKYKFPNVTHMMVEMNYSNEIMNQRVSSDELNQRLRTRIIESHFDYERSLEFISANKSTSLQEVWLLHLSDSNSNQKLFQEETQKLVGVPVYIA